MAEPDDDEDTDEHGYELVLPFVCCDDHGGPYQSDSFVAGVYYGALTTILEMESPSHEATVPTPLVEQLDLLAMSKSYTMLRDEEQADEFWTFVTFTKVVE